MKKIFLAALVGILFAACGSKQETQSVEEQAQTYAEQLEQAVQAGDTATAKNLAQELKTWHDGLTAEEQLKVLTVTDIDEVIAKAEKDLNVSLVDAVVDAAEQVATGAQEAVEGVADQAKEAGKAAVDATKEAGKNVVNSANEAAKSAINDAAKKGTDAINEGAKKSSDAIKEAIDKGAKELGLGK
ncbi:MAG: hypothetical protein IJT90_04670 [Bacteroidaceae bacterium]|nr:hypothetical protein [Bacteroidaceae bacterium]